MFFFSEKKNQWSTVAFFFGLFCCLASSSFYSKYFMSMLDVSSKLFLHFLNFFLFSWHNIRSNSCEIRHFYSLNFFSLSFTGYGQNCRYVRDLFLVFSTSCVCKHTFDMLLFSKRKIRTFLQTLSCTKRWAFQVETANSNDSQQFSHQFDKVSHEMPKQTFL